MDPVVDVDQSLDPFNGKYGMLLSMRLSYAIDYLHHEHSFTKRQSLRDAEGGISGTKWSAKRIQREARVLQLVAEKTTIPVPRFLEEGFDAQKRYYVTMERIDGVSLDSIGDKCRQNVYTIGHATTGKCLACQEMADSNADTYIRTKVLPQLQSLTSNHTGLGGFLVPPPRIVETQEHVDYWPVKTSNSPIYSFVHGDLARHNIRMCSETLEVTHIYDWEQAGYLPAEMERELWCAPGLNNKGYYAFFEMTDLIEYEIGLITP